MTESSTPQELGERYRAVTELFGALSAPVRAALLHRLTIQPYTVTELSTALGISQPLASQHLRTLREVGLVRADREGRTVTYELIDDHVAHILLDALAHSRERRPG